MIQRLGFNYLVCKDTTQSARFHVNIYYLFKIFI